MPEPLTRRGLLQGSAAAAAAVPVLGEAQAAASGRPQSQKEQARMSAVGLTVNGREVHLQLDPRTTLLDALREHLHLTGTKKGCDHGQCGACTVIVEGRRINSCLTLAVMHEGDHVTTIEGLGTPEKLHPMQRAFITHDGYQCGYCTPGQSVPRWLCWRRLRLAYPAMLPRSWTGWPFPRAKCASG